MLNLSHADYTYASLPPPEPTKGGLLGGPTTAFISECVNGRPSALNIWFTFQLVFLGFLSVTSAFQAYQLLNVPTVFNESNSLENSIFILVLFVVIIVPHQVVLKDDPDSSALTNGVAQSFCSLTIGLIMFAPKFDYITIGRGNDPAIQHIKQRPNANINTKANLCANDSIRLPSPSSAVGPNLTPPHLEMTFRDQSNDEVNKERRNEKDTKVEKQNQTHSDESSVPVPDPSTVSVRPPMFVLTCNHYQDKVSIPEITSSFDQVDAATGDVALSKPFRGSI